MTISFSLHNHAISYTGEPGVRIAASAVCLTYSLPGSRLRRASLDPGSCSTGELAITDAQGDGIQTLLSGEASGGIKLEYRINRYPGHPYLLLRLSVQNLGREAIRLHELVLLDAAAGQVQVEPPGSGLDFFKVGWHGWAYSGLRRSEQRELRTPLGILARRQYSNDTSPLLRRPGEFCSEGWAILAGARAALVTGLVSTADQFGQVYASCRPAQLGLRLVTQADGSLLSPGETFDSEWGYLQVLALPDADPAREYVCAVARQMEARQRSSPPAIQWTHWYQFFHDISAEKFITNLQAITRVRPQVPFQAAQLDDGYQSAWGDWTTPNEKFPGGLAALGSTIRQSGFTPGVWLAPFVVQPGSDIEIEHPDWLLQSRRGRPLNAGFFYNFFGRVLDTTQPAVQDHLRRLADRLTREWGYGFLKLDFCYAAALPGGRSDPHATRAQALRLGLEAIRQGCGEETFLLGCGCPFGPAIGLVDAMRISPDTAPTWEPFYNWLPWASPLVRGEPSSPALRNSLRHQLNLSCLHRRWWWNDPDCLLVRSQQTKLSEAEVLSKVTLTGLSGGMVVDSDDLTSLTPQRLELLSLLTPILSPGGQALDLLESEMPALYHVVVHGAAGQWHLVGLFNWQNCPAQKKLTLARLGITPGQPVFVFDFWAQRGWLTREGEMAFPEIPAHGCRLLRITPMDAGEQPAPRLVGDTLHITQGLEIADWSIGAGGLELHTIDLGRQVRGGLWLSLPERPVQVCCNGEPLEVVLAGENVYRLDVNFTGRAIINVLL